MHLAFVLNNALGSPDCFQGHSWLPVGNRWPPKRLANASASSDLAKQNTKSPASWRREYVSPSSTNYRFRHVENVDAVGQFDGFPFLPNAGSVKPAATTMPRQNCFIVSSTQVQARAAMQHAAINTFFRFTCPTWAPPVAFQCTGYRHRPMAAR